MVGAIIFKRILLALLLGGIIGFERERAHKTAGLRTHTLVCVASTLFTLLAVYGYPNSEEASSRIIANIMIGIGFIGGGAILRQDSHVTGTTTAASLWAVGAIGTAVGMGFIFPAVLVTLIGYIILTVLWRLEMHMSGSSHNAP